MGVLILCLHRSVIKSVVTSHFFLLIFVTRITFVMFIISMTLNIFFNATPPYVLTSPIFISFNTWVEYSLKLPAIGTHLLVQTIVINYIRA